MDMKRVKLTLLLIVTCTLQLLAGEKWIVTDQDLTVWDSPNYLNKLGMIHSGYEIDAEGLEGDMIRFVYNGQTAYVASYCCKKVEADAAGPEVSANTDSQPANDAKPLQATRSAGQEMQEVTQDTGDLSEKGNVAGSYPMSAFSEKLSSFPVWLMGLLFVLGLVYGAILIVALVFTFYYVFKYDKLRLWLNGKCGVECVPAKRFNKLLQAPLLSVLLMGAANVLSVYLVSVVPESLTVVAVVLGVCAVIGCPLLVLHRSYTKQKSTYGSRVARWLTVYAILSVAAIYFVCVIAFYVLCIVAVLFAGTFLLKQTGPGRALDISNRSCSNCNKFGTSSCPYREKAGNGCCDAHSW